MVFEPHKISHEDKNQLPESDNSLFGDLHEGRAVEDDVGEVRV